jgi:hypothetical protein
VSVTVLPSRKDVPGGLTPMLPWPKTVMERSTRSRNVAVTTLCPSRSRVAGLVEPERLPLQPAKPWPAAGVAVSVTVVPTGCTRPVGSVATLPSPSTTTSRLTKPAGRAVKVAVTERSPFMVIVVGLAEPVRSPLQPANWKPEAGMAVSVTTVPKA